MKQKKILIFAQGTIGDMITALSAMQKIRNFYKEDVIHLHNTYPGSNDVHKTLFEHLNLFDKMFFSQVKYSFFSSVFQRFRNWFRLFLEHYDAIYEFPNNQLSPKWILRAFCAKKICTIHELNPSGIPRYRYLLNFLADCGIPRTDGDEVVNWNFQPEEIAAAKEWFSRIPVPQGYTPFVMCTGGKSQIQHWHLERYAEVLKKIVPEYHLFPVFVGVDHDRKDAEFLIKECGMGIFSQDIGVISLREMIIAFNNFKLYLGNDTGILHLAGAAGIPSVSVSSARDPIKYWNPLNGQLHKTAVADISCKWCRKDNCDRPENLTCINKVSVKNVFRMIQEQL